MRTKSSHVVRRAEAQRLTLAISSVREPKEICSNQEFAGRCGTSAISLTGAVVSQRATKHAFYPFLYSSTASKDRMHQMLLMKPRHASKPGGVKNNAWRTLKTSLSGLCKPENTALRSIFAMSQDMKNPAGPRSPGARMERRELFRPLHCQLAARFLVLAPWLLTCPLGSAAVAAIDSQFYLIVCDSGDDFCSSLPLCLLSTGKSGGQPPMVGDAGCYSTACKKSPPEI